MKFARFLSEAQDAPGIDNISMSPKGRDQRALELLEIFRYRGMQDLCRRCEKSCKVLKGSEWTESSFICLALKEKK